MFAGLIGCKLQHPDKQCKSLLQRVSSVGPVQSRAVSDGISFRAIEK